MPSLLKMDPWYKRCSASRMVQSYCDRWGVRWSRGCSKSRLCWPRSNSLIYVGLNSTRRGPRYTLFCVSVGYIWKPRCAPQSTGIWHSREQLRPWYYRRHGWRNKAKLPKRRREGLIKGWVKKNQGYELFKIKRVKEITTWLVKQQLKATERLSSWSWPTRRWHGSCLWFWRLM